MCPATPGAPLLPWPRLASRIADGSIPAIADSGSLAHVLHRKVGDILELDPGVDHPVRLRIVGSFRDPVLQSELIISEENFVRAFPFIDGYRFFLIGARDPAQFSAAANQTLSAYGFESEPAENRATAYLSVENADVSMFRTLGAVGLFVGLFGLLFRNVRREDTVPLRVQLVEPAYQAGFGLIAGALFALLGMFPILRIGLGAGSLLGVALLLAAAFVLAMIVSAVPALRHRPRI